MTEQKTTGDLDFEALRQASEQSDAEALAGLYAEVAEVQIVNRDPPPSSPLELRGREAIAEYLKDVCVRDVKHQIKDHVVGEDRIAFNEACEYPDVNQVLTATMLEVKDGKIFRQVSVEAWDE